MSGMTLIVKTTVRLLAGFMVIFAAYLALTGHQTPGGGFPAGVVLASVFMLLLLAFGAARRREHILHTVLVRWESVGAGAFLAVALLGFVGGGFFSHFLTRNAEQPHLFSSGSILLSNVAIALKVGAGLFGAFLAVVAFRPEPSDEQADQGDA
jgi:multisubunit Na+/H+ antiporter MnhB subunit